MARCEACYWCKQRVEEDRGRVAECVKNHSFGVRSSPVIRLAEVFTSCNALLLRQRECGDFVSMNDDGSDWSPGLAEASADNRRRKKEWNKSQWAAKGKKAVDAGQVSESA